MINFTIRAYDEHHTARDMYQVICSSIAVRKKAEQMEERIEDDGNNGKRKGVEEKRAATNAAAKKRKLMDNNPSRCEEKDGVSITYNHSDSNGFKDEEELKDSIKSMKIEIKRGDYNILDRFTNIIRSCSLLRRDGTLKSISEWDDISVRGLKISFSNDEFNQISMNIRVETNGMKYCLLKSNGGKESLSEGSHTHNHIYFTFFTDTTYKNNYQRDYLSSMPFSNESLFKYKFYQRCFSIKPTKYKLYDRPDMITCKDLYTSNYAIELLPSDVNDVHEVFKAVTSRVLNIIKSGSGGKNVEIYEFLSKTLRFSDAYVPYHGLTHEDVAAKIASVNTKKKSYLFNRAVSSSLLSNQFSNSNSNSGCDTMLFDCDESGIDSGSRSSHLIRSLIERAEKNDTTNDSNYYGNENGNEQQQEEEEEELLDLNRESDDDDDDCIVLSNNSINNNKEEKDSNGYEAFSFDDY
jgi:hypothetical protein